MKAQSTTFIAPDKHTRLPQAQARKPVGGLVFITVVQLCLLWWAYHVVRCIHLQDLRVWCAARLLVASRRAGQIPHYTHLELLKLLGWRTGGHHVVTSLRRLEHFGLLTWTSVQITFARSPADLRHVDDITGFYHLLDRVENNGRSIPFPRQILRCIVRKEMRATMLATVLGHLLRCLYYDAGCSTGGWCNPTWIADVFGVDRRHVKRARQRLVALGWLELGAARKGLGTWTRISLTWTRAGLASTTHRPSAPESRIDIEETKKPYTPAREQPPHPASPARERPPLLSDLFFPSRREIPDSPQADPAPPAVSRTLIALPSRQVAAGSDNAVQGKTKLPIAARHFSRATLQDDAAVDELCHDGVAAGLWTNTKRDRLKIFTLVQHALRTAKDPQNPGAQFAENLRHKRWYGNDEDEAAAEARLVAYERLRAPRPTTDSEPPPLSKDAWCVRELQRDLARQGFHGDVLAQLQREDPTRWTEAHCHAIARELAHSQQATALSHVGELGMDEDWRASPCPADVVCAECGEEGPACTCREVEDIEDG